MFRSAALVVALMAAVSLSFALSGGSADAHGPSPARLSSAGWLCFNVPGLGVHCAPPGAMASSASLHISVFDTDDPTADHAPFLGTELLIREDLYHGQPCPQDGHPEYEFLPSSETGLPANYYACHHYETGH